MARQRAQDAEAERRAAAMAKPFGSAWLAAQCRDDPGRCYDMRSVAELLDE